MTTLLNAFVNGRKHGKLARGYERFVSRRRRPYYGHESRSISMPGDEDCRGARERNKSRIGIIAVRDGTGMHTCPPLFAPLMSIALEVDVRCTRGANNRPINSRYFDFCSQFRSGYLYLQNTSGVSAFARVRPQNDLISRREFVRVTFLSAFIIQNICRRCLCFAESCTGIVSI